MSFLDVVRIATPCSESWAGMTGDDRARHCRTCDKTVFDLSRLTRADAEALLAAKGTNLCARYFERTDGTIVMADCLVRRPRRRLATAGVVAAALVAGTGVAVAIDAREPEVATIGEIELPDDTEATLPKRDTQTATDELADEQPWRFTVHDGAYLSGAITFDMVDEDTGKPSPVSDSELIRKVFAVDD